MKWLHLVFVLSLFTFYFIFLISYLHEAHIVYHTARDILHPNRTFNTYLRRTSISTKSTTTQSKQSKQNTNPTIPHIIHQTWKTKTIPFWALPHTTSWTRLNPTWEYKLWTDKEAEDLIKTYYPSLYPIWNIHLHPVQRADVFRYAVIHKYGGVYADIDVSCVIPIDDWIYPTYGSDLYNIEMLIGWEALPSKKQVLLKHFATEYQLCQWTFAAVPNSWYLQRVLQDVQDYYESGKHQQSMSIIKSTGPGMFSNSIRESIRMKYNNVTFGSVVELQKENMKESVTHVGELYILPLEAFGSRGGPHEFKKHIANKNKDLEMKIKPKKLVVHGFQGSWKEDHKKRKKERKEMEEGMAEKRKKRGTW